jgi:hypothetical protein
MRDREMRSFLANTIMARRLRLASKAGYKTAASTSSRHHITIILANREVSI